MTTPHISFRTLAIYGNLFGLVLLVFVWLYHEKQVAAEQPYLRYMNSPFPVATSAVRTGHAVAMKIKRCSSADSPRIYSFTAKLVPDDNSTSPIAITVQPIDISPGCDEIVSTKNMVPINTPIGRYHLEGIAEIPGKYRTFLVPWRSESFQVVAEEPHQ